MALDNVTVMAEFLAAQTRRQEEEMESARKTSGDGGDGMELRIARLEAFAASADTRLGLIEQDLRALSGKVGTRFDATSEKMDLQLKALLGIFAAGFVTLAGLTLMSYVRLDDRIDARFQQLDAKIDKLDAKVDARFQQMDNKIDKLAERMDIKFDKILERLPPPPAE